MEVISRFFVRNYKSILEETLDCSFAEGKAPNGYRDGDYHVFLSSKNVRCVPCLAIYGANGSGKSNLLEALRELLLLTKPNSTTQLCARYRPNKINRKYNSTYFELSFIAKDTLYIYGIEYNANEIKNEFLKKKEKFIFKYDNQGLYTDLLSDDDLNRIKQLFEKSCQGFYNSKTVFKNPIFSMIPVWLSGISKDISNAYQYLSNICNIGGNYIFSSLAISVLQRNFRDNPKEAFNEIVTYMKKMDVSVSKITSDFQRILKFDLRDGMVVQNWRDEITFYHPGISGTSIGLKLSEESLGTQLLFGILGVVLYALKNGSTLVIDELDSSLHPLIVKELVRLFKDKSVNTKQAQLVFSLHDTSILEDELMRISEATFITNSPEHGTKVTRLSDFEGVTNADNFRKLYIDGRLGAVPFIKNYYK